MKGSPVSQPALPFVFVIARREATRQSSAMAGLLRFARNDGLIAAAVLLAACGQQAPSAPADRAEADAGSAPPPAARPFAAEEKTALYEFDFSWPAEVAAIPELAGHLQGERDKAKAALIAGAKEDKAMRDKGGMEYHPHSASTVYEAAGQSPRLLSLRVDVGGYSGGAHGHYAVSALLWDRQAKSEIDFADLFAERANRDRLLNQRWCDALHKARQEKRGEALGGGGLFDDCPGLDDIAIIPADADRDGRFEKLLLVASPYVAGPWVEGAYEIELAVTPELTAGLKNGFKPSFEAQGVQ